MITNIKSVEHYGESPLSDAFGKTVTEVFAQFNEKAKENPHSVGIYAAEALGDIAGEANLAIAALEARLNRLEEKQG